MKGRKEEKVLTLDASNSLGSEKHIRGSLLFPCALLWAAVLLAVVGNKDQEAL